MVIVIFGQPSSGKTTLGKVLANKIDNSIMPSFYMDGDEVRYVFKDTDYSRGGRLINTRRIVEIAHYLSVEYTVVISAVMPYSPARIWLEQNNDNVFWVYLTYKGERGKENFWVQDFEEPVENIKNFMHLDTSELSEVDCIANILKFVGI
jgi:hypothetical protein